MSEATAHILVVDDEPQLERLIRQRFRSEVRAKKYEFHFAENGLRALEVIKDEGIIDIVLTDINMPIMDGLTLVNEIQEKHPTIKSVIVSAYGDMLNIRKAMNFGAYDFLIKPIEFADLRITVEKTLEAAHLWKKVQKEKELIDKNEQLHDLDRLKTEFFTNISHEFRTPLTIISGMADQIEEEPGYWLGNGLNMIHRNALSLLDLVNQILDLRKLEAHKMSLNPKLGNVIPVISMLVNDFRILGEKKDVIIRYEAPEDSIFMDFDRQKIERIVSNILNNSLKSTPEGGQILFSVTQRKDHLLLKIQNSTGEISTEQLKHLFDHYHTDVAKGDLSAGIGFSLVNELINLMGGEIKVKKTRESQISILLDIPITKGAPAVEEHEETKSWTQLRDNADNILPVNGLHVSPAFKQPLELPSLLIVEDNPDILSFLVSTMEGVYQVETAQNGTVGLEKAFEVLPDIIVSDVMMPIMNGFELCEKLKGDPRTDHIPIILLTAKADIESKLDGLQYGADAYLPKPFKKKELQIRIEQLLETRKKLQEKFEQERNENQFADINTPEGRFLNELHSLINENISDENFGILEVCEALDMSRTQLHRKIKAVTGTSTSLHIRDIRLEKARRLFQNTDSNVSEVAFQVGFKDPKYFSRVFIQKYGVPPIKFKG